MHREPFGGVETDGEKRPLVFPRRQRVEPITYTYRAGCNPGKARDPQGRRLLWVSRCCYSYSDETRLNSAYHRYCMYTPQLLPSWYFSSNAYVWLSP
jgi:hypothetical protein